MFYYLGCTFCISYLYAILYIHALMLNDIKKKVACACAMAQCRAHLLTEGVIMKAK